MSYHLPDVPFGLPSSASTTEDVTRGTFLRYDNVYLTSIADYYFTGFPASWIPHRFIVTRPNGLVSTAQIALYSAPNGLGLS